MVSLSLINYPWTQPDEAHYAKVYKVCTDTGLNTPAVIDLNLSTGQCVIPIYKYRYEYSILFQRQFGHLTAPSIVSSRQNDHAHSSDVCTLAV